jgi:hypothetical protein
LSKFTENWTIEQQRKSNREYQRRHPEIAKEYYATHKELCYQIHKRYRHNYPEIDKAEKWAERHIPLGPECEFCGSTKRLQRHHPDYNYPEIIVTACCECHNWLRKEID